MEKQIFSDLANGKLTLHVIDNLDACEPIPEHLPHLVRETIINSLIRDGIESHSNEVLRDMVDYRSIEQIRKTFGSQYFIYLKNTQKKIVGFSAIQHRKGKYYYTWLQVLPEYRKLGIAQILSGLRDDHLRKKGVSFVQIESLVFVDTIRYHLAQGFIFDADQRELSYSIRMKKHLNPKN